MQGTALPDVLSLDAWALRLGEQSYVQPVLAEDAEAKAALRHLIMQLGAPVVLT